MGELEELHLEDLDLENRKLSIRQSKSLTDRSVYLTDTAIAALQAYLERRGSGPSEHIFLYRNRAMCKDLVRNRIKATGRRVGVKVYPHRLRHTCATQLLNAGCRVTSIQRFLGHKQLNTTMIYTCTNRRYGVPKRMITRWRRIIMPQWSRLKSAWLWRIRSRLRSPWMKCSAPSCWP